MATEEERNITPYELVLFLQYHGEGNDEDIEIIEQHRSNGFGYFESYFSKSSMRRKIRLRAELADDYLDALLREDDENLILNMHLHHLGDTVEMSFGTALLCGNPIMTSIVRRGYGWSDADKPIVRHQYTVVVKGADARHFDDWRQSVLPCQIERSAAEDVRKYHMSFV
ncbi:hypothetical protein HYS47_02690 [Candidatus Woesearchaeota archaeon]|nr:hypothetical protein [Candidatus Woesearchaeota archaeon]